MFAAKEEIGHQLYDLSRELEHSLNSGKVPSEQVDYVWAVIDRINQTTAKIYAGALTAAREAASFNASSLDITEDLRYISAALNGEEISALVPSEVRMKVLPVLPSVTSGMSSYSEYSSSRTDSPSTLGIAQTEGKNKGGPLPRGGAGDVLYQTELQANKTSVEKAVSQGLAVLDTRSPRTRG